MSTLLTYFLALFALFTLAGTAIAAVSRKMGVKSVSDFYTGGGRLGGFLASMTYAATTYSSFMMIGLVGFSYARGVGSLGFELAYYIATLGLLALVGPTIWRKARERGWVSPTDVLTDSYGSKLLGVLTAIVYLVALVPYCSAQFIGVGKVFESLGLGYVAGVAVMGTLSLLWTVLAGLWSVAATDAFQGLWMITVACALVCWLAGYISASGLGFGELTRVLEAQGLLKLTEFWKPHVFLAFTLPWMFFAVTNPQVLQRLFMPRDARAYYRMVSWFGVYGLAFTVLVTLLGLTAAALTAVGVLPRVKDPDAVTPTLLTRAPPLLAAAVYVGVVAASLSTVDSIVLSVSSALTRELARRESIGLACASVATLTGLSMAVAYVRPGYIVELSVLSSVLLLPLAPLVITAAAAKDVKRLKGAATLSLVLGEAIAFAGAAALGPKRAFVYSIMGVPLSAWILAASSIPLILACVLKSGGKT